MIEQAGLIVEDVVEYRSAVLNRTPSPKLGALKEANGVVIRGFRTRKAKQR
jgi:hypothetical protein